LIYLGIIVGGKTIAVGWAKEKVEKMQGGLRGMVDGDEDEGGVAKTNNILVIG
jgi:hypothetical protein